MIPLPQTDFLQKVESALNNKGRSQNAFWQKNGSVMLTRLMILIFCFAMLLLVLSFNTAFAEIPVKRSTLEIEQVKSEFYPDGSKMLRIRDPQKLNSGELKAVDIFLTFRSKIVMSDEQEQMLLNGIPLTFVYDIRLKEKAFFSSHDYSKEIRYLLLYHGLSKQFVVKDLATDKQHSYPTLSLALLSISTPTNIEFEVKDERGFKMEQYEGRAKLWLDIEALPTPLRIPAYLSSNWWLNSSWYEWELTL